jgi:glyoxylase-like metal-dependent hydrolase (beta-lactamase superfamily II)
MCPFGGRLISGGDASVFGAGEMVVHSLLVETDKEGLVIVDTGIGLDDVRSPMRRLGPGFVVATRPRLREEDTAVRQVERLGFAQGDVRHVVVTHLDVDHAGGIPDFPEAKIHVHRAEQAAALRPLSMNERQRYRKVHFAHNPKWELHDADGEKWFGFDAVRAVADDVHMIPLPGHTRGHCAIAVKAPPGAGVEWYLHCGDGYFFHTELDDPQTCPPGLKAFQSMIAQNDVVRRANAKRIRELHAKESARVRIFSAHCAHEFRALSEAAASRVSRAA